MLMPKLDNPKGKLKFYTKANTQITSGKEMSNYILHTDPLSGYLI